jgi:hypothetical protein
MTRAGRRIRTAAWHLRHGGVAQLRQFLRRDRLAHGPRTGTAAARRGPARAVRAGVVLDEALATVLRDEWQQVPLTPGTAADAVGRLDLVVLGSGAVTAPAWGRGTGAGPAPVEALVAACADAGVPAVLWDTGEGDVDEVLPTAARVRRVYVTEPSRGAAYRARLGDDAVRPLPLGVQPTLQNPVRRPGGDRRDVVAFAGGLADPRQPPGDGPALLTAAAGATATAGARLHRYGTARRGAPRSVAELVAVYRRSGLVVLPPGAPTGTLRWSVLESTACGTPVVTARAGDASVLAGDGVVAVDTDGAGLAIRALLRSRELRDRAVHRGQRRIWREHTYGARVQRILGDAGLAASPDVPLPAVTALVSTRRPDRLQDVLRTLGRQRGVRVQLALLAHGVAVDEPDLRRRAHEAGVEDFVLLCAGGDVPLGTCLNRLVGVADGETVAKIDDDDVYGPHYLADQVHALAYSRSDVVGKQAHHVYLESVDATVLRFPGQEHRYTDLVAGPTVVARRDVARGVPFPAVPRGEDTGFLRGVVDAGGVVYSADRFGFLRVRSRTGAPTWDVTDAELLAGATVLTHGRADRHVLA